MSTLVNADATDPDRPEDRGEIREMDQKLIRIRETADEKSRAAQKYEEQASQLTREARRTERQSERKELREAAAEHRENATDFRAEARELRSQALELSRQRDERTGKLRDAIEGEVLSRYQELLREAAAATQAAVEAHRRLERFQYKFDDIIVRTPEMPSPHRWLVEDDGPDSNEPSGETFVQRCRRTANDLDPPGKT